MANPLLRQKLDAGTFFVVPGLQDMIAAVVAESLAPVRRYVPQESDGKSRLQELFTQTFPQFTEFEPHMRAALQLSLEHESLERAGLLEEEQYRRGFRRGPERPLACDLLVVDEMSMVDVPLMAALLAALPEDAGLLLVGDADQLPSVGPGQVLADLIASERLAVIRLDRRGTSGTVRERVTDPRFDVPTTVARFGNRLYLPNARFGIPSPETATYNAVAIPRP